MSGICGVAALDGNAASLGPIGTITARLERRGPDGTHIWTGERVAFGHALLATTPEALTEVLPLTDAQTGCTITADVRLDNREVLIPALGLSDDARPVGDGELILRSYLRWGEACVDHLLGDFAFAIWDPRSEQIFAARDPMGLRQLIYFHAANELFVFATEADSLIAHEGVPARINEGRIADYLDNMEPLDLTATFYADVYRLPPAHCLTVTSEGLLVRRYWELQPEPELKLGSDEAYAQAFLEIFTEAVRCRLRSPGPVGSMLSGGMDSSSAAAVAASLLANEQRGPLLTFSAVGPDPEKCIETRTIRAAAAMPGIAPTFVRYDDLEPYVDELIRLTDESGEPFDSNMVLIRAVYLAAHRAGVKVVLDGVGGDIVLNAGNVVARLLRQGHFRQAIKEATGKRRFVGPSAPALKTFVEAAWVAFVPRPIRRLRRRFKRSDHGDFCAGIRIDPNFAARSRLTERQARYARHVRIARESPAQQRARVIQHPNLVVGRERYDRVASQLAIEPRDPFMDLRVLRFSVSLPWRQLQADGWPKLVLRRAMQKHLPAAVIWRRGNEHLGRQFIHALFRRWPGWQEDIGTGMAGVATVKNPGPVELGNQASTKPLDTDAPIILFGLLCSIRRSTNLRNTR